MPSSEIDDDPTAIVSCSHGDHNTNGIFTLRHEHTPIVVCHEPLSANGFNADHCPLCPPRNTGMKCIVSNVYIVVVIDPVPASTMVCLN